SEQDKDWAAAEQHLLRAVTIDREPDSLVMLASLYLDTQRAKDALATYRTLAQSFPDFAEAWYGIGRCAVLTGADRAEGIAALERYLKIDERPENAPSDAQAQQLLEKLREQKGESP